MGKFSSGVLFPDQEWDALRDVDRETVANRAPAFQSTRLSDVEGVSVRLLNCFSKVGVETLGALLAMSDDDVLRIPHLGMKTLGEVRELRGRYSAVSGEVQAGMFAAVFRDYVTTIDEEQSAVLCEVVGDPLVFATTVLTHGERSLPWLRGMEIEKFRRMLPPLSAFLRHVSEQSANSALSLSARSLSRCLDTVWPEKVGASLSPVAREALQMKYSELFNRRPVRFRNSCRRLARVEEILPYVYGDKEFDTNQFANFGKKTLVDALAFIDEVRPMVRQFIADLETNGHEPAALLTMKSGVIGKRYPFLDSADCDELAAHTVQGGAVPPLYVLAKFLERDTERTSAIHRMSYGIEPESRRMSIDEIAERLSLTRERTRQISVLPLDLPPQLEPLRAVAARQVAERIYGEDDPLWKPLAADSLLTFTGSQMMGLVASVLGTFTLEELGPGHRLYLIPRPWQREVSVSTALTQVERHLARPLRQPVKVDLTAALRGSRGSADGVRVREELYDLIFDCYAEEPRVGRAGAHTMRIAPCRVNRGPAIEALLAECGKATTSSELLRLYNERYPDEQISTLIHFKTYLFLNPNILAKGKSGYFVLRSWANEYTGTRIEYVEQLIRRAGRPLSVAEVMDDYEKMFPNSRRETVQYYLCTYGKNRFTPYGHGLYGLAGVDYPGYTVVQQTSSRGNMLRSSIERYRNFVLEHQRFPFITSDDEDERRLYMWRCNIRSRMRHVTGERDHELLAFDEEHRHLPHNRYEQRAHDMIKRVKDVVTQTGAMPTPQRHPDESLWLVQAAQRSEQWKDNRRAYYDDLQAFLRERGLV